MYEVQPFLYSLRGRWHTAAAGRHLEVIAARAVDLSQKVDESQTLVVVFSQRLEHHGSGAVAKKHASAAIGIVDDTAHRVGANNQDAIVGSGPNQMGARCESVQKSGARGHQIKTPGMGRSETFLDQAGSGRKQHVGRDGAHQNGIQIFGGEFALGQRLFGRLHGEI